MPRKMCVCLKYGINFDGLEFYPWVNSTAATEAGDDAGETRLPQPVGLTSEPTHERQVYSLRRPQHLATKTTVTREFVEEKALDTATVGIGHEAPQQRDSPGVVVRNPCARPVVIQA